MKFEMPRHDSSIDVNLGIRMTILYEDFASGVRAKNFAERLHRQLGQTCQIFASIWKFDLLEFPLLAAGASREAANFDFIAVSLRGDALPSEPVCRWIEAMLDETDGRDVALVVLRNSREPEDRTVKSVVQYFHCLCAERGVSAFCPDTNPEGRDQSDPLQRSRKDGWSVPEKPNAFHHEYLRRN